MTPPKIAHSSFSLNTSSLPLTPADTPLPPERAEAPAEPQFILTMSDAELRRLESRKPDDTPGGQYLRTKAAPPAKGRTICVGVGVNKKTNHDLTIAIRGGEFVTTTEGYRVCKIPGSDKTVPALGTVTPTDLAHAHSLGGHLADTVRKSPPAKPEKK